VWGVGKDPTPSKLGKGLGGGCGPPQKFFWTSEWKMVRFGVGLFCVLFLQTNFLQILPMNL